MAISKTNVAKKRGRKPGPKPGVKKAEIHVDVPTPSRSGDKYNREIKNVSGDSIVVDVYDVIEAFKVTCPALQHLIKKALCSGLRGHKDGATDLVEIQDAAERAVQLNGNRR